MITLKYILAAVMINIGYKICPAQSIIDIPSGTEINVGTGAEICADLQTGDGILSGGGTWCGGTLPVELASFTCAVNVSNVILTWSTISEINNSGFEIERSFSGNDWLNIVFIQGSGNSQGTVDYEYTDRNLLSGIYKYRLKQIDYNGNHEYFNLENEVIIGVPEKFELSQNYPNPFNPETKINYGLPEEGNAELKIYDLSGKEILTLISELKNAGYYTTAFNAGGLSSGTYLYRITINTSSGKNFTAIRKMILLK